MDDEGIIGLEDLTTAQWMEIRLIAVKMMQNKRWGDDQMKIAIMAFTRWLHFADLQLAYDTEEDFRSLAQH